MERKTKLHTSVKASNGLKFLLMDPNVTASIAASFDDIEKIVLQIQRDVAKEGDDEKTLQVVKGTNAITEALLLFKVEGEADIRSQQNSK